MADIFDVADKFKREMLRRDRAASNVLTRRYGELWKRIRREIETLTRRYYDALAAGEATSPSWVYRLDRLQRLQRQVETEIRAFARFADTRIQVEQWSAVDAAQRHAHDLTRIALGRAARPLGFDTEIATVWNRLPNAAIADLVGFLHDGSPLKTLLDELGPGAAESVGQELVNGLGLGLSPREVANHVRKSFGGDLVRALRVSRTETLRAYREATARAFRANDDIVSKWVWHATPDTRTCAACWAMHGTIHPLTERLDDHPNGRCSMVPLTQSFDDIGRRYGVDLSGIPETRARITPGVELFDQLSREKQIAILGPAKYNAFASGEITLNDVVGRTFSTKWGSHRYERSLKAIRAAA